MNKLFIFVMLLFSGLINIEAQIPFPELIERIKPSVVGIEAHDDTLINGKKFQSYGSGVLVMVDSLNVYALTNEHVIAIKDTNKKTVRYAKNIVISINTTDNDAVNCKGKIFKTSEKADLSILTILVPEKKIKKLNFTSVKLTLL